ncbi:cobalt-precorrin-6x reductase [Hyphomicrobium denitrificans 1NES1]|uniref:Cobalt-precorrin-6x reductase n=1 Tax=Hyphomicrobium denitrificans 1NES1 TaxID=670307 RepID=N0B7V4_9HYPH|nr:cobalt-precorrin-6A reductase [Hyphomicrobium denitrificans]AGK59093.1 cobalt-precorrin-6x reductase [Hyphomicrobium denitrificans 1NES1]
MDATTQRPLNLLLLGGTSEAARLAKELACMPGIATVLSLAGRTSKAAPSPVPVRIGGFGGIDGLENYLRQENVDVVVDATHPFAAQISNNAATACTMANVPLLAIERPPWEQTIRDNWSEHATIEGAVTALPEEPSTIFSALGRSSIPLLCAKPQHRYVIRVVDPMTPPPELSDAVIISARGPFRAEDDIALFREYRIVCVLAKNSGGDATYAKIEAAQQLQLPVYMVKRPTIVKRPAVTTIQDALAWITHHHSSRAKRGV